MLKKAVISGVSSGIGKEIAKKFKNQKVYVIGLSRSEPDFEIDEWIQADLLDQNSRKHAAKAIIKKHSEVGVLINVAGIGLFDTWEDVKEEDLKKIFELNLFAVVGLTQDLLPLIKKSKGSIINASSVAGKFAVPCMGGYCATKYALNAFTDSLRIELQVYDVHVLNLIIGRISTGFSSRSLGFRTKTPSLIGDGSVASLADKVYKAYLKRKDYIIYPAWYRWFILLVKLFPRLYAYFNIKKWDLKK